MDAHLFYRTRLTQGCVGDGKAMLADEPGCLAQGAVVDRHKVRRG